MNEIKKNAIAAAIELFVKQGPLITFLVFFCWLMWNKVNEVEKTKDLCHQEIVQQLKEQNAQVLDVVRKNSEALNNFSFYLRERKE